LYPSLPCCGPTKGRFVTVLVGKLPSGWNILIA